MLLILTIWLNRKPGNVTCLLSLFFIIFCCKSNVKILVTCFLVKKLKNKLTWKKTIHLFKLFSEKGSIGRKSCYDWEMWFHFMLSLMLNVKDSRWNHWDFSCDVCRKCHYGTDPTLTISPVQISSSKIPSWTSSEESSPEQFPTKRIPPLATLPPGNIFGNCLELYVHQSAF